MRLGSWLRIALRALWQPRATTHTVPPWSEATQRDYDRVADAEWGRAIRSMAARMATTWAVHR